MSPKAARARAPKAAARQAAVAVEQEDDDEAPAAASVGTEANPASALQPISTPAATRRGASNGIGLAMLQDLHSGTPVFGC